MAIYYISARSFSFRPIALEYVVMKKLFLVPVFLTILLSVLLLFPGVASANCPQRNPSACNLTKCAAGGTSYCCDTPGECTTLQDGYKNNTFKCQFNPNNGMCTPDAVGDSCKNGYSIDPNKCLPLGKSGCTGTQTCVQGPQPTYNPAYYPSNQTSTTGVDLTKCTDGSAGIQTAIGCIHVLGSSEEFLSDILRWAVGIGGGIAFLLILYAGFMIMTASGSPDRLKAGQELLTSAISGLILLVFSIFILKFIGVDILGLGAFGFGK
jgi:hypothetical protein